MVKVILEFNRTSDESDKTEEIIKGVFCNFIGVVKTKEKKETTLLEYGPMMFEQAETKSNHLRNMYKDLPSAANANIKIETIGDIE